MSSQAKELTESFRILIIYAAGIVDGRIYTLSEMLAEKPVYMVFGSFT